MASSFIDFKSHGFWINDSLLEISLSYILHSSRAELESAGMDELIKKMELSSLGYFPGFISLHLDEHLTDDSRQHIFVNALQKSIDFLKVTFDNCIPIDDLNSFIEDEELQPRWARPLDLHRVIKVIDW